MWRSGTLSHATTRQQETLLDSILLEICLFRNHFESLVTAFSFYFIIKSQSGIIVTYIRTASADVHYENISIHALVVCPLRIVR